MTLCIATSGLTGCAAHRKASASATQTPAPSPEVTNAEAPSVAPSDQQSVGWTTTPLAVRSEPVAVKEGSAPLVYLVETPGLFRVHDQTTGRDIAGGHAAGRSIVRIDVRTGVVFGGETLLHGPLDRDHHYVIYRDPAGANMIRQGTFQIPPPRAARRPQLPPQQSSQDSLQDHGGFDQQGGSNAER